MEACLQQSTKKYYKNHYEKENDKMKMCFDIEGELNKITMDDDYKVYEVFADIEGIPETVSVEEIVDKMKSSPKGLVVDETNERIYFNQYANDFTTMASLGVQPEKIYRLSNDVKREIISG